MASEADIRAAETTRLVAILEEHGTEAERFEFLLATWKRAGFPMAQYWGTAPVEDLPLGMETLLRVATRAQRRKKLGIPARECFEPVRESEDPTELTPAESMVGAEPNGVVGEPPPLPPHQRETPAERDAAHHRLIRRKKRWYEADPDVRSMRF